MSFLQKYYPVMEQAAEFLLTYQSAGSDGYLHAVANAHETQWAVQDPTTDLAADQALFPATISAATLLTPTPHSSRSYGPPGTRSSHTPAPTRRPRPSCSLRRRTPQAMT